MQRMLYIIGAALLLTTCGIILQNKTAGNQVVEKVSTTTTTQTSPVTPLATTTMKLTAQAFAQESSIPSLYTCDGQNISPELNFADIPVTAKSLVLVMDDPDVPKNLRPDGMFDHWVVYDIEPTATGILEGQSIGTKGTNTAGKLGYIGPCPPDREHRYFFKLYALDTKLDFGEGKTKAEILAAIENHVIEVAELMGRYNRKK